MLALLQVLGHFGVGLEQGLGEDLVEKNRLRFGRNELPSEAGEIVIGCEWFCWSFRTEAVLVNDGCPTKGGRGSVHTSTMNVSRDGCIMMHTID